MTKMHLEALARTLREQRASLTMVSAIADVCYVYNPRFDRDKFVAAALAPDAERV